MKILLTGSLGMLGQDLYPVISNENEVIGIDIKDVDITDIDSLKKIFLNVKPECIIHTAAYTDVEGCEKNINIAYKVNSIGTRNIAVLASELNSILVYISTDYVFDGTKKEPYIEFDQTNPLNIYGKSKLAGEEYIKTFLSKYFIIRTSWLFGKNGKNFVDTILKISKTQKELKIVNDQIGTPTYTKDLALEIKKILKTNLYGTYHVANKNFCSWYEFACEIIKNSNKSNKVFPIMSSEFKQLAKRPANSRLRNYCLELTIGDGMRLWQMALKDYMGLSL